MSTRISEEELSICQANLKTHEVRDEEKDKDISTDSQIYFEIPQPKKAWNPIQITAIVGMTAGMIWLLALIL